jgi:hypothetical protein
MKKQLNLELTEEDVKAAGEIILENPEIAKSVLEMLKIPASLQRSFKDALLKAKVPVIGRIRSELATEGYIDDLDVGIDMLSDALLREVLGLLIKDRKRIESLEKAIPSLEEIIAGKTDLVEKTDYLNNELDEAVFNAIVAAGENELAAKFKKMNREEKDDLINTLNSGLNE